MQDRQTMINFVNVSKRYPGGHDVLQQLNLQIKRGTMSFITGPSGAGKSTLLKLIALIEPCTRGQILINGTNLRRIRRQRIPLLRRNIGFIFQNFNLLYDRTVFDNVALPLIIDGYRQQEIGRRVRAALDKVGLLHKEKANPLTLAGGEQQRVAIARAVVHRPFILLADEPTGNLDPALSLEIMKLFEEFNQIGATVLIATHDYALIEGRDHPIFQLHNGQLLNQEDAGAA